MPRPAPASPGAGELERALAAKDWPRAEQLLAQAIERSPQSAALLKQIAGVFLADRRPLNAAIALKKAEALAPLDPESRFRLVLAYVAMGQREWARPELERLVAAAPETAIYHYWLGRLDYDAGQYAAAVAHLQAAAIRDPSFPRTFDNLGLCYEALNQIDLAIAQYREAVRLNRLAADPSPWPAINLGSALARGGAYEEAETLLREAVRIDPAAAPAQYISARCWNRRTGRTMRSRRCAPPPTPIPPTPTRTTRWRGSTGGRDGPPTPTRRWPRSRPAARPRRAARRELRRSRDRRAPPRRRGRILALSAPSSPRAQPRRSAAAAQAEPALAPRHVLDAIAAALGRDDLAAAKAAIDPAIAAFPEDPVVHNLAGVIDARRGESRAAQDHFEAAIRLQPRSPAAYVNLGRLLQERAGADPAARPAALAVYAPAAGDRSAAAGGAVPDGGAPRARRPLRRGAAGIDRLPEAARGRPPVLAVRAVALAGSGDADGARTTVAALAAHPQLAREDIDAVLPALAGLPERGTEQALLELLDRRGWATPATLRRLAAIESAGGRYVEARAWLEKAAARGVPDAALLIELARAAFKAGDAKGALGYLAHARDLEPTNVAVHFLFGIVCVELNLGAEAYESLARAVALAPEIPTSTTRWARCRCTGTIPRRRCRTSRRTCGCGPAIRADALRSARPGITASASRRPVTDLAAAANDPQTAAGAHYYLARIARQRQDLETARREIDAALRANPSHADGWAERGLIETRQGDYAGAEAALQKALALDPDNYEATLHLAALYGRTRDPREAAQEARLQTLVARREIRAQEFLRLVQAVP